MSVLFWGSRGSAIDAGKTFRLTEVALRVLHEVEGGVEMHTSAILMGRECLDREAERSQHDLRDRRRRDTFVLPPFFCTRM